MIDYTLYSGKTFRLKAAIFNKAAHKLKEGLLTFTNAADIHVCCKTIGHRGNMHSPDYYRQSVLFCDTGITDCIVIILRNRAYGNYMRFKGCKLILYPVGHKTEFKYVRS